MINWELNGVSSESGPEVPMVVVQIQSVTEDNKDLMVEPMDLDLDVSASEASKGGIKYEVIIEKPKCVSPPRVASPAMAKNKPELSVEILQQKLNAAEERRQSLEAERLIALTETSRRVEEAAKKRASFIISTKENLEQKMEAHIGNRESHISDLKTKLNNHNTNRLLEVKQNFEASVSEQEEKLKAKLETAEKNREKVLQEKLESLKKHDEKVELVRTRSIKGNTSLCEGEGDGPEK